MSIKSLISLWVIAITLLVVTLTIRSNQNVEVSSDTKIQVGKALLSHLDSDPIREVKIHSKEKSKHFKKVGDSWVIPNKEDFPANSQKVIRELTGLFDSKVSQPLKTSDKYHERFGVDEKSGSLTKVEFYDKQGNTIEKVYLGNMIKGAPSNPMMGGSSYPIGRKARLDSEPDTVYSLSQTHTELESEIGDWLNKKFLVIENIQSISKEVTAKAKKNEGWKMFDPARKALPYFGFSLMSTVEDGWTLSKTKKDESFALINTPEGKQVKQSAVDQFKSLLSSAPFEEVLGKKSLSEWLEKRPSSQVYKYSITTFDGFTYKIQLSPESSEKKDTNYVLSYEVDRKIPKNSEAKKESEDDKKEQKKLTEKLESQRVFSQYLYIVQRSNIEPLLRNKEDFLESLPDPETNKKASEKVGDEVESDEIKQE